MRDNVEDRFFDNVEGGESIIVRLMYNIETLLMLGGRIETSLGDRLVRDYIMYNMELSRRELEKNRPEEDDQVVNIGRRRIKVIRLTSKKRDTDLEVSSILDVTVKRIEENIERYVGLTNEILDGDDLMAKLEYTVDVMRYGGDLGKVMEMVENYRV